MLTALLRGLVSRTSLILAVFPPSGVSSCDSANHAALMQAIEAKNTDESINAMIRDLRAAQNSLAFVYDQHGVLDIKKLVSEYRSRNG